MLTSFQAILLGALQGIAELFPVSSLGHSVLLPALLGWQVDEKNPDFLIFLVATHLATAVVLFLFFYKDWMRIFVGIFRSLRERKIREDDYAARLGWLIIVSTIPAGLLGLLFEEQIRQFLISPRIAALFLLLNGVLLFGAERIRKKAKNKNISSGAEKDAAVALLSWPKGLFVGSMQALALIPGFSRTGASLAGGLLTGLTHEDALRFSFLLATPLIGAAAVLKLPELWGTGSVNVENTLFGAAAAAFTAFLAVKFLTRYFHLERHTLTPFAVYCAALGIIALVYLG